MILWQAPSLDATLIFTSNYFIYLYFIGAYLYGAIPFGFIIGKQFFGIDLREHGSKNIGATNVMRVIGRNPGLLTFFLDSTKSALVVMIGWYFFSENNLIPLLGGIISILGHTKSIYLKFQGGKGVASFFGALLVLDIYIFAAAALSWGLIYMMTRVSAIAAVMTFLLLPVTIYQFHQDVVFWLLLFSCFYVISLHHSNIKKLLTPSQ